MTVKWDAPPADQIEVSVFARGSGECILIHYGDGRWAVIDSFQVDGRPIALAYLDELQIDPATSVELVVATHWHDDHIRGLADVYRAAVGATGVWPLAMLQDEFKAFAAHFSGRSVGVMTSGVREYATILKEMERRDWLRVEPGKSWTTLLRHPADVLSHGVSVEFEAMSPSSFDVITFLSSLALEREGGVALRVPHYGRNDVSCALHVRIGEQAIVLGADLENVAEARSGWKAVFGSQQFPAIKATLLKVPHHGSVTGHHDEIWTRLCEVSPVATLTPWMRGRGRLPTKSDVARIRGLAGDSYTASEAITSGDRHRLDAVNAVLKRTKSRIRNVNMRLGHVRHRLGAAGWETELFGAAAELKNIAA